MQKGEGSVESELLTWLLIAIIDFANDMGGGSETTRVQGCPHMPHPCHNDPRDELRYPGDLVAGTKLAPPAAI